MWRCAALHSLGRIGDRAGSPAIRKAVESGDKEIQWSAIPAMARAGDPTEENVALLRRIARAFGSDDVVESSMERRDVGGRTVGVITEPPGARQKILRQMTLLALASMGDENARKEVLARAAGTARSPLIQFSSSPSAEYCAVQTGLLDPCFCTITLNERGAVPPTAFTYVVATASQVGGFF